MFSLTANPMHFGVLSAVPSNTHQLFPTQNTHHKVERDQVKFPLPLCHSGQVHTRPHSTPMLCSSAHMFAPWAHSALQACIQGRQQGKEGGLFPSLAHLQCFRGCSNTAKQLGRFPFHPSPEWLWREFIPLPPYHSCRQRHSEWLALGLTDRTETGLSLCPQGPWTVFTARHPLYPQNFVKPINRGPQTLCKAQRSGGPSWGLRRLLQPWKMLPHNTEVSSNCAPRVKRKGHQPVSGFDIDVSIKKLLAMCSESSKL